MKNQSNEAFRLFCPRNYRMFSVWRDHFIRGMPWLFSSGVGLCVIVSAFRLDIRWGLTLGVVTALTVWPAIIGWFVVSGLSIIWRAMIDLNRSKARKREGWSLRFGFLLMVGLAFLFGATTLLSALLSKP
jgi:hypothetical protein